jgi:Chitobiase/beta-hexosaminidase C-terminal domain
VRCTPLWDQSLTRGKTLRVDLAICFLAAAVGLSGCGSSANNAAPSSGSSNPPAAAPADTSVQIQLHVGSHEWSVSGASIQLYAAGTQGAGSSATPLLTQPVATDTNGNLTITEAYTCPAAASQLYLVASGGNPGLASGTNNQALRLLTLLGPCNQLSSSTIYPVNEVTTVGSIWPLSSYMTSATQIGSASGDASFPAALTKVNQLVNLLKGVSPGTGVPAGYAVQSTKLNTLASDLHGCVASSGGTAGDGSPCGQLFSLTTAPGGVAPTDTIGAALHLAQVNQLNVESLFRFATAYAAFQPVLLEAPTDWDLNLVTIPAAPVFAPPGGTYASGQQITLSSTSGATLHYTVDGSTPSLNSSVYSSPLVLSSAETVRAVAITDEISGSVSSATYGVSPLHLAFTTQPSNVVTSAPFSPAVAVSIVNSAGTVVQTSAPISLTLNGTAGSTALSGAPTSTAAYGVASFPNLSISSAGSGYTLTASSAGIVSATSSPFNASSPADPRIAVTLPSSSINIGSALTGKLTLNTPAGSSGAAIQLSSSAASVVSVTPSLVTIPAGQRTGSFSYKGIAAGTAAISAAATGYVGATAQVGTVLAQPVLNGATSVTVAITSSQVGVVSPMAVGMKFSRSQFGYPNQLFTGANARAVNNFKALSPLNGESCLLSLGVDANLVRWVPGGAAQTPGQVSQADIDALAEFVKAANCQLDYSAPVLNNTPENAADEVSYVQQKVGNNLIAVGFGNEPDPYTLTPTGFAVTWHAFASAALAQNNKLQFEGPNVGIANILGPWVSAWYQENSSLPLVYAGQHYYVYGPAGCAGCTEALMLENRSAEPYWNAMVSQKDSFEASLKTPLPVLLTETNNFYNGGAPGVSNSYGSALYAYDFVFQASQAGFGTSAFTTVENWSQGYSPLNLVNGYSWGPRPEYYGMYMAALAGYGPMLSTTVQGADGLHAYTINNVGESTMAVALVNTTGTNYTVNATLPAGISPKACSDYVMSDSAGLTDTVAVHLNIQGGHFDADSNITMGAPYNVPLNGTTATIAVPTYSAVLVNCTY